MYVSRETHIDALSPQLTKHINHPTAQPSPNHKHRQAAVGRVDSQRGLSLRFPRFLRVRDDKGIEDATPAETIADLFRMQVRVGLKGGVEVGVPGGGVIDRGWGWAVCACVPRNARTKTYKTLTNTKQRH